jgi:hypothetical protein
MSPKRKPRPPSRLLTRYRSGNIRLGQAVRRGILVLLAAFVLAGLAGVFGTKTASVAAERVGYSLHLDYAKTGRRGVPVEWRLIRRAAGFAGSVKTAVPIEYLDRLNVNDIEPAPSQSTTSGDDVSFDTPLGDELTVFLDAEVDPAATGGSVHGSASVLENDRPVATVDDTTRVMP